MSIISYIRRKGFILLILSLLFAFILFSAILFISGLNPISTYGLIIQGSFGGAYELSETFVKVTPLLLCAVAVALPARLGLMNIGSEGQLIFGAIGATWVALYWNWLPANLVIPLMFLISGFLGGLWALIPGVLKAKYAVNEVIVTLLLNFVAIFFLEYLIHSPWRDSESFGWPFTKEFPIYAVLPTWNNTRIHIGLAIGILTALILYVTIKFTKWGFNCKVIGENINVASNANINIVKYIIMTMFVSGIIAGLAGFGEVSAIQGRLRSGISLGYGYTGFLIAWLSNNNLLLIVFLSFFVGALIAGSDQLQLIGGLPYNLIEILQGLLFVFILVGTAVKNKIKTHNV